MKISVIVPTHFRKEKLENLLCSLTEQVFSKDNFEVIVVLTQDDDSYQLYNQFKKSLNITFCEIPNDIFQGRSASAKRNYGASTAKASWIAFIDDDCIADANWLKNADLNISDKIDGIEGYVNIPKPKKNTLTYKGIKRLSTPQGYQTCNVLYNKKSFEEVGGFDDNFPFYLEDTDLGWSILKNGGEILYVESVIVSHPVPESEPYRLITGAKRTEKLVYLYKKHPKRFIKSKMEVFRFSYKVYIFLYLTTFFSYINEHSLSFKISLSVLAVTFIAHLIKMFKGCSFSLKEFIQTALYTLAVPCISFYYLTIGIVKHKKIPPI